jgi:hypothetical protein
MILSMCSHSYMLPVWSSSKNRLPVSQVIGMVIVLTPMATGFLFIKICRDDHGVSLMSNHTPSHVIGLGAIFRRRTGGDDACESADDDTPWCADVEADEAGAILSKAAH